MNPTELYILNKKEPYQSIMLYIREVIFKTLPAVEETYRYSVPYYTHDNKPMLHLDHLEELLNRLVAIRNTITKF